jgi:type VI secretion system protein ImpH
LIALSGNSLCLTDRQEFSYANMFGATMRNSANLKHMLQIYLKKIAISLHEFVPQWVEVDDVFYIGDNNLSLGQNTLLGERVLDVNGRIDIEIGPMLIEDATALLPKQEQGKRLIHLLQRYIGNLLEFRVVFLLVPGQQICKVLGHDLFVLAWGAWLGKPLTQPYMQPIYSSKLAQFQFDD